VGGQKGIEANGFGVYLEDGIRKDRNNGEKRWN